MASSSDKKTSQATAIEPPPAPHIDGEAILTIFVHKSLKAASGAAEKNGSPYSDRKKLNTIGNRMLLAAYSLVLFDKKPMFSAEDLESEIGKIQESVEKWVDAYKWRQRVRVASKDIDLKDKEETRFLMDAYVGAVFIGGGFTAVLSWVAALVAKYGPTPPAPANEAADAA